MNVNYFRDEFKIFEKYNFLDWAVVSPAPMKTITAVRSFLDSTVYFPEENASAQHVKMDSEAKPLKQEISKLLNASEDEIAITGSSTSQGIQIAFESINPQKGENVVTCDTEFPLAGTELQKWKERGVTTKVLKNKQGIFSNEELGQLIDKHTKIVFLDSVTWVNGFRFELDEISKMAHEVGAYLVLDSIQHMGAMTLDTKKTEIDFIAAGGHKWLTTPLGIGILYVNKKLINRLKPPFYGYMNAKEPKGGWDNFFRDVSKNPIIDYDYVTTAKKFEYGGTGPYPGIVGLANSVSLINSVGINNVQNKILKLKKILIDELNSIGARVIPPVDEKNFSAITTFNLKKTVKEDYDLVDVLNKKGIRVSGRGSSGIGGIRVSIHYPNEERDIINFVDSLKKLR
ncbi:MAG: aminotransferase class V-fold PLP-dependent enzyme [Nitrososphaerota archaeon]